MAGRLRPSLLPVLTLLLASAAAPAQDREANTLVPPGRAAYVAGALPDRIILLATDDPARSMAVSWRAEAGGDPAGLVQVAPALDGPGFEAGSRQETAQARSLPGAGATAWQARVDGLRPDTPYVYRVGRPGAWSEWLQFRTAAGQAAPFTFVYLGDAQNRVRSQVSRVMRQAFRAAPDARLVVHAGDLVNGRQGNHDDEWAEWFHAGGANLAEVPNLVAAGNHEYLKSGDGDAYTGLMPHWPAQFPVPGNGAPGLETSTYFVDLMGVRFVVLDSLGALELGKAQVQAEWLGQVLQGHGARWTVVVHHHPMTSVSRGRDNPPLRAHWQPLFERHGVDLVLQGHDHAYGRHRMRGAGPAGDEGPVYVVSVAGPKQYLTSPAARRQMARTGEDLQLYQVVGVEHDRLRFEARTATGRLYDAFDLVRRPEGGNAVVEYPDRVIAERRCERPEGARCRN